LPTPQPPAPPPPQVSPEQHLAEAQSALERVQDSALARSGTRKSMSQLRKDFDELVSSYKESGTWRLCLHDVERDLVLLIGGGGPEPENLKAAVSKDAVSDPATRETLKEFRTSVELFYDATINNTR